MEKEFFGLSGISTSLHLSRGVAFEISTLSDDHIFLVPPHHSGGRNAPAGVRIVLQSFFNACLYSGSGGQHIIYQQIMLPGLSALP